MRDEANDRAMLTTLTMPQRGRRDHWGIRRCPAARGRRAWRGLGLIDSMLALAVMIALTTMAGQVFSGWVERRISQAEARALSAWADAGATWLLRNRSEIANAARPGDITGRVRAPALWRQAQTPHRNRTIRLWMRNTGPGRADVMAVASGPFDDVPIPTAGDGIYGVGMVHDFRGARRVIGPALTFDLEPWLRQNPSVTALGDMVAIRTVFEETDDPYLHRRRVEGRPELNRMEADLIMGGRSIAGAGRLAAEEIVTGRIDGPVTVSGAMTVNGAMAVERAKGGGGGTVHLRGATITNDLETGTLTARDVTADTINAMNARINNLEITGGCTGCAPAP